MKWGNALSKNEFLRTCKELSSEIKKSKKNMEKTDKQEEEAIFFDEDEKIDPVQNPFSRIITSQEKPIEQEPVISASLKNSAKIKYDDGENLFPLSEVKPHKKIYKRGPYRKYTKEKKERALKSALLINDIGKAAKMHDVPLKNLRRWLKNGIEKKKGGRKTRDPEMEHKLKEWIVEYESTYNSIPSKKEITSKALELTRYKSIFKASKGWYEKFILRHFPGFSFKLKLKKQQYKVPLYSLYSNQKYQQPKPQSRQETPSPSRI